MSDSDEPVYLDRDSVSEALEGKWDELISLIEKGFQSFSEGHCIQPARIVLDIEKHKGVLVAMPAYDMESEALAIKVLTVYSENEKKDLPVVQSLGLLFDPTNGRLKASMDAQEITNMRTAAASLVATKHLMSKDPECVAILGCGNQGHSHYQATKHLYDIKKFCLWDVNEELGKKLAEEITDGGFECKYYDTVEEAVKDADLIHTCTLSPEPILMRDWVKEGAHINAVGAANPNCQELEPELVNSAVLVVDSEDAALAEAGDIIKSKAEIFAEIGELISGKKVVPKGQTTIFKSVGIAIEDTVAINFAYNSYCEKK